MVREISNLKINSTSTINLSDALRLFNLDITGSVVADDILSLIQKIKGDIMGSNNRKWLFIPELCSWSFKDQFYRSKESKNFLENL